MIIKKYCTSMEFTSKKKYRIQPSENPSDSSNGYALLYVFIYDYLKLYVRVMENSLKLIVEAIQL